MEDVTDTVFRRIVMSCGVPDVHYTEFTSVEGMFSPGSFAVTQRLVYDESEKQIPLIAQIWGKTPDKYSMAVEKLIDMGFDGVDLNFGCPVAKITKQGCCSALINDFEKVDEILTKVLKAADGKIPVSVKTRCGFDSWKTQEWMEFLMKYPIWQLTLHGRIAKDMSKHPADWSKIAQAVEIRDRLAPDMKIIGNGDIKSLNQADEYIEKYGVDGVMIGRGIFENVWLFDRDIDPANVAKEDWIRKFLEHAELFKFTWEDRKNFAILKKFAKVYIRNFKGSSEIREAVYNCKDIDSMISVLRTHID